MLTALQTLARARLRMTWNGFRFAKTTTKIGVAVLSLLGLAYAGGIFFAVSTLVGRLAWAALDERFDLVRRELLVRLPRNAVLPEAFEILKILESLPSGVAFFAFVIAGFGTFAGLLSSLYLSGDMDRLLAAPIPMRAVFLAKFFNGLTSTYAMLFVFVLPAGWGYGVGLDFHVAYYPAVLVVLWLLPLLPASFSTLLVMVAMRIVPAHRSREMLTALGGFIGVGVYVWSQTMIRPGEGPTPGNFDLLNRLDTPMLPSAWAGRALVAVGNAEWTTACLYGGLLVAVSAAGVGLCLALTEKLYYAGWSNLASQGGKVKRGKVMDPARDETAESFLSAFWGKILPSSVRAVVYKDLRLVWRDLRNVQQVIFPLAIAGLWIYQLVTGKSPSGMEPAGPLRYVGYVGATGISYFVCMSFSSALAGAGVSREGKQFWLLKTAPLDGRQLLLSKFLVSYLPYPTVGVVFVILVSVLQGVSVLAALQSVFLLLMLGVGTTAVSLGFGAAFPKFDWEHPHQQTTFRAGCFSFIFFALYAGVMIAAVGGTAALAGRFPAWDLGLRAVGWTAAAAVTATVCFVMISFGAKRIDDLDL